MGPFGVLLWISHFIHLNAGADVEVDNHISSNALFTEVPHDIITHRGQDVEMACSFSGTGSTSVSLEIQWWYLRHHRDWAETTAWSANQVLPIQEMTGDATKISVVKVAGSNISHRLRLSSVKPADEGMYECRVIDFSNNHVQHHTVRAFLKVQTPDIDPQLHEDENLHQAKLPLHKEDSHDKMRDKHNAKGLHDGENVLRQQDNHKRQHRVQSKDSPPAHHQNQHPHEGIKHQENNHTNTSKKRQTESYQSEVRGLKGRATENPSDCSTDDCVFEN